MNQTRRGWKSSAQYKPSDQVVVLAQAATFLRDLPSAWSRATAAERNMLARLVFEHIEITNDRVTAVLPTVDFAPNFNLTSEDTKTGQAMLAAPNRSNNVLTGGSDGGPSRKCTLPAGAIIIANPQERIPVGTSRRSPYQQPRQHKLTSDLVRAIQRRPHHTLRELAEEFGVSHETIRNVLKR